jgi:hypothetical protein
MRGAAVAEDEDIKTCWCKHCRCRLISDDDDVDDWVHVHGLYSCIEEGEWDGSSMAEPVDKGVLVVFDEKPGVRI